MIDELYFYDIYPKIVRKGIETPITIQTLASHVSFEEGGDYIIRIYPITSDIYSKSRPPIVEYSVKALNGAICFSHTFIGEQEHFVRIFRKKDDSLVVQLSVYSLEEDLFGRYPYRGDFHVHTYFSDGRDRRVLILFPLLTTVNGVPLSMLSRLIKMLARILKFTQVKKFIL